MSKRNVSPSRREDVSDAFQKLMRSVEPEVITRLRTKMASKERLEQVDKNAELFRYRIDKDIGKLQAGVSKTTDSKRQRAKALRQSQYSAAFRRAGYEAIMQGSGSSTQPDTLGNEAKLVQQECELNEPADDSVKQRQEQVAAYHARLNEQQAYWEAEAAKQGAEAHAAKAARLLQTQESYQNIVSMNQNLRSLRNQSRLRLQAEGPTLDPPVQLANRALGVYGHNVQIVSNQGSPYDEPASSQFHTAVREVDDVNLWSNMFDTREEEMAMAVQTIEADLARKEQLYFAISQEMQSLVESIEHLNHVKLGLQQDLKQQEVESSVMAQRQSAQPHQEPSMQDIQAAHLRRSRTASLKVSLQECEHAIGVSQKKLESIRSQERKVAAAVAGLREKFRTLKSKRENGNQCSLPTVVGRSINAHNNDPLASFMTAPRAAYDGVRLYSDIKLLQEQGKAAASIHSHTKRFDQNLWLMRMKRDDHQQAFQHTVSGLVQSSDQLNKTTSELQRYNVLSALHRFFSDEQQLHKVEVQHAGSLQWWKYRVPTLCKSVVQWSTERGVIVPNGTDSDSSAAFRDGKGRRQRDALTDFGISLGAAKVGFAMGMIELPRSHLWQIVTTVSTRRPDGTDAVDITGDRVVVKFGPALDCLQTVGTVNAVVNPETGAIAWDVYYQFKGNKLAFRFEFHAASETDATHMTVLTGQYEQAELEPLQIVDYTKGRVRSSLVTELAIEERQGKLRVMRLMEELINAEASATPCWDSSVLNGVMQRYDRNMFLKLIRAEILLEHETNSHGALSGSTSAFGIGMSPEYAKKLSQSEESYRSRKQEQQRVALELAKTRIGKVIRIFDEDKQRWCFVLVRDCTVQWVDNKTKALILYVVQEIDKGGKATSGYLTIDLSQMRYFEDASDQLLAQATLFKHQASDMSAASSPADTAERPSSTRHTDGASGQDTNDPGNPGIVSQTLISSTSSFSQHDKHRARRERLLSAAKFSPGAFARAVPKVHNCEHRRGKAWATAYGKGIKCADCGKDLTELHEEVSQLQGFGTGGDEWLDKALTAHRKDDSTFKYGSAARRELVEEERLRLEKERREMEIEDDMFIDFKSLKVLYAFDQRHQDDLRRNGVFRQGVQWTEDKLTDYIKAQEELYKKAKAAEGILITAQGARELVDFTDLPPSTFRAQDEARKVAYEEMKWVMMRIRGFQSRVTELTVAKIELVADHQLAMRALQVLHSDAMQNSTDLQNIGIDLQMSAKLLQMAVDIRRLLKHSMVMLRDAEHNEKQAELNYCGVQEVARAAEEEARRLRRELKSILKEQYQLKTQVSEQQVDLDNMTKKERATRCYFGEVEEKEAELMYCCPGRSVQTPWGALRIREFRFVDQTLVVELPFCNPRAKAYINARVVINMERAIQRGEVHGMEREDVMMADIMKTERRLRAQEVAIMSREDADTREWLYYARIAEEQQKAIESKVEDAVLAAHRQQQQDVVSLYERQREVAAGMLRMTADYRKQLDLWTGAGPRPALPSAWQRYKLRQQLNYEVRCRKLATIAANTEREELAKLDAQQYAVLEIAVTNLLIDSDMVEMIRDVATAALFEGLEGTRVAERQSGIVFPSAIPMQYSVYSQLRDSWKQRKDNLRRCIVRATSQQMVLDETAAQRGMKTEEELLQETEILKKAESELARQKQLCAEMAEEEQTSILAWKAESIRSISERRAMAAEERWMRVHLAELQADEESESDEEADRSEENEERKQQRARSRMMKSRARRREELMRGTVERRRQHIELEKMIAEDEQSKRMERYWREEEEAKKESKRAQHTTDDISTSADWIQMLMSNLEFPENWDIMTMVQQNYWIETQVILKRHEQRQQELISKQTQQMDQAEATSLEAWRQLFEARSFERWNAELAWMQSFEALNLKSGHVNMLKQNLLKLELLLQDRGFISLKSQEQWVRKKHTAAVRKEELDAARSWRQVCHNKVKQRRKLKRHVEQQCLWVDTASLSGFHQRYRTERLRMRIYDMYFQHLCQHIVVGAEIVATERKLLRVQEGLASNTLEMTQKKKGLQSLWREYQTEEMLRLRRSALGKKMFGAWQRDIMRQSLKSWARYLQWQRGDREAFQLKYQLLRNEIDLQRAYRQQLFPPQTPSAGIDTATITAVHKGTLMKRHKERLVQCTNCGTRYLEAQNHSLACAYHPGQFRVACPRSCPNPGRTRQCVAHKRKRWSCCDESDADKPCSRCSHVPAPTDPVYDKIVKDIQERDRELMTDLDRQLAQAKSMNHEKQIGDIHRSKLKAVEDEVRSQREYLDKYNKLGLDNK